MFLFGRKKKYKEVLDIGMETIMQDTELEFERHERKHVPAGCQACGGDYPNCKSSCPMFDND